MNFKEDVSISKHQLDFEWIRQPNLTYEYSLALADAILIRDRAKQKLELVEANLNTEIRTALTSPEGKKPTESAIESEMKRRDEYNQALEALQEAQYNVNVLNGANKAIADKRSALENLVKLYGSNYWSEPRAKDVKERVVNSGTEAQIEGLAEAMSPSAIQSGFAIGFVDSRKGFAAGPFETEQEAFRFVGENGMVMLKLNENGTTTPLSEWSDEQCGWLSYEKPKATPKPKPVKRPNPIKR